MFRKLFGPKSSRPDPKQLARTLLDFIQAETWGESRRIVEEHPELLGDEIRAQAADARLVYLAATEHGGLALGIGPTAETPEVFTVPLPELTGAAQREHVQGPDDDPEWRGYLGAYFRWRRNTGDAAARAAWFAALEGTLAWLGKAVMGPLVEALQ